jgi:hypothetical protein
MVSAEAVVDPSLARHPRGRRDKPSDAASLRAGDIVVI